MKSLIILQILLLTACLEGGCTGSGAVTPLTPAKASQADSSLTSDSDVIYWTAFPVTFALTDSLNGVFLLNKKVGWACGNNGIVLHYDGDSWEKVDTGLAKNENLMALAFANQTEGWIVGTHGTIIHYNNGSWSLDNSQTEETLYSITITPAHTAWVVGSNGTILTYNGITWGSIAAVSTAAGSATTVTSDIYSIGMSGQNNGWAVGNLGLILRYDGQKWDTYSASPSTERLNSVSVINDVQAWIVGAYGTILRFNGTAWTKITSAFSGFDLYQVFMKSDDDGWATGQDGTLIYYDGSRWISHQKPEGKPSLNSIYFYKDLGFIVGQNGAILKFQPNGQMTKFSFLFKGNVSKQPSKTNPFWTLSYTLMNQSPKASPLMDFELAMPKGFEGYQPKATQTPGTGEISKESSNLTPTSEKAPVTQTPTSAAGVTSTASGPSSQSGTGIGAAKSTKPIEITGAWKMKDDNLVWEIGNIASSELKTITVLIQEKKNEKKEYPVLLKASLVSLDKVMAEAAAVTLLVSEPKEKESHGSQITPTPGLTPKATILASPTKNSTPEEVGEKEDASESGTPSAQSTPTPGN